jgi:hypothetical protein
MLILFQIEGQVEVNVKLTGELQRVRVSAANDVKRQAIWPCSSLSLYIQEPLLRAY